jgi:hypothetical protein
MDAIGCDTEQLKMGLMQGDHSAVPSRLLDHIDALFPKNATTVTVTNDYAFPMPPRPLMADSTTTVTATLAAAVSGDVHALESIVFAGEKDELEAIEMSFDRSPEEQFMFEMWSIPHLRDRIDLLLLQRRLRTTLDMLKEHIVGVLQATTAAQASVAGLIDRAASQCVL